MGTIINGNKWAGACVNGNIVSGLVKNGAIFYKKNQQELYKRRIMVGDNLTGKRIYFSFPDDYATIRQGKEPIGDFIVGDGSETIWENSLYEILVGEYSYVYIPDMLNSPSILSNDIGSVTNIEDCLAYRCCYIEDPNIRPIQIGDNLSGATLYFVIPDNVDWFNVVEETEMYECISTDSMGYFAVFPQDGSGDGTIIYNSIDSGGVFVRFSGAIEHNISKLTLDNDFGTIISIDGGNSCPNLNQYILVDTTTLGT